LYGSTIEDFYKIILEEENEIYGQSKNQKKLVRTILNNKENFCMFINQFINTCYKVKPQQLEKVTDLIDVRKDNFKEIDYIYRTKDERVYYLLEHQTIVDKKIGYRMLNYMVSILKEKNDNQIIDVKQKKLPQIIPIVLYTGNDKWDAPKKLEEIQESVINLNNILNFEYILINNNDYTEEELLKQKGIISYMLILEKSKEKEHFIETLNRIFNICTTEKEIEDIKLLLNMILTPIVGEEVAKEFIRNYKFNSLKKEYKYNMQIEKEMTYIMLKNGASIATISKYIGVSKEKIKKIIQENKKDIISN